LVEAIVCGFGVVGKRVAMFLDKHKVSYVAIEERQLQEDNPFVLYGDAASEDTLKKAGIEEVSTVLAVTDDDKTNAFITLLSRKLNKNAVILARVEEKENVDKLDKAGADYVLPMTRAGRFLAKSAIEPFVVDFLDMASLTEDIEITQVEINEKSKLADTSIKKAKIWKKTAGVNIIAIRRHGDTIVSPTEEEILKPSDRLVVIGNAEQIKILHNLAEPEKVIESTIED
jgi:voltage-gated potassium channel